MYIPWGNVFIVILLGLAFSLVSWYISKKVSSADEYMCGSGRLGVAFGSTSLLAFWITGNTVMAAPESAYGYGVIGALAYGILGGAAVVLFAPLAKRIHQVLPNAKTVGDFYAARFDTKNYYLLLILCAIYTLGLLMTQGIGGGLLLEEVFDIPYLVALPLTFVLVIIYAALGGFNSVTGVAFFQVVLIVAVVLVVPPIVYFSTGISPIYDGMAKLAPEKLDLLNKDGLLFLFAGTVMGVGEVFMDNTFWQRAYAIRKDKVASIFMISGIGWLFVPMAVGTLAFVAIANGLEVGKEIGSVNQLAPYVAKIYGGNFVGYLFLVCVWSALASTIAGCLNALSTLFVNDVYSRMNPGASSEKKLGVARLATVVIGIAALLLSLPKLTSMLQMLIFFGVINGAFIFPIIFGLFWDKLNINAAFYSTIAAVVVGYIGYFTLGSFPGIIISGYISALGCIIGSLVKPGSFDFKKLLAAGK